MALQDSREMNYEGKSRIMSSPFNQGEEEGVDDELSDNSLRFPKDGSPQLGEQGDNICQIKWYNEVCSREKIPNLNIGWKVHPKYGLR